MGKERIVIIKKYALVESKKKVSKTVERYRNKLCKTQENPTV